MDRPSRSPSWLTQPATRRWRSVPISAAWIVSSSVDDGARLDRRRRARSRTRRAGGCRGGWGRRGVPGRHALRAGLRPTRPRGGRRIHSIKGRDEGKPSAVMYFSPLAIRELVSELGERSRRAISELLPGPVTLVIANPGRRYPLASPRRPRAPRGAADRGPSGRGDDPGVPDQREPQRGTRASELR